MYQEVQNDDCIQNSGVILNSRMTIASINQFTLKI